MSSHRVTAHSSNLVSTLLFLVKLSYKQFSFTSFATRESYVIFYHNLFHVNIVFVLMLYKQYTPGIIGSCDKKLVGGSPPFIELVFYLNVLVG